MRPVRLSQLAVQDIAAARDWFETREAGLGGQFVERVNETISRIEANPFQYREVIRDARRANLKQFKYSVWFRIKPDHSVVIGCIAQRQNLALARRRAMGPVEPTSERLTQPGRNRGTLIDLDQRPSVPWCFFSS